MIQLDPALKPCSLHFGTFPNLIQGTLTQQLTPFFLCSDDLLLYDRLVSVLNSDLTKLSLLLHAHDTPTSHRFGQTRFTSFYLATLSGQPYDHTSTNMSAFATSASALSSRIISITASSTDFRPHSISSSCPCCYRPTTTPPLTVSVKQSLRASILQLYLASHTIIYQRVCSPLRHLPAC